MRKLIMWNVVTVDGCFEGTEPWDLSFHELVWGPELEALSLEQLREADMIVYGENTYKGMAEHWSKADGTIAELMNSIKKVVCSKSRESADWNNTIVVKDAVSGIRKLKEEGDAPMYVFGSGILSRSLLNEGLFDELRLCIAPIVLGKGRHLFTDDNSKSGLKLIGSRQLENGGVLSRYEAVN